MHLIDYLLRDDPTIYGNYFAASNQNLIDVVNKTDSTIGKDIMDLFQNHNDIFRKYTDCKCTVTYVPSKGKARGICSKRDVSKEQQKRVL
ncbi:MAG: hypothetical protein ACOX1M_05520 [Erysipelotrichaceae bacterium]|jgi:hypothetical protein